MKLAIAQFLQSSGSLSLRGAPGFTTDLTWLLPSTLPTVGDSLRVASVSGSVISLDFSAVSGGGGGGGSVTSVGFTAPSSTFSVANAPITGSGVIDLTFKSQAINLVLASPVSGGAGLPVWRSLVSNDLPNLDASKIATGLMAIARLPVGTTINTVAAGNDTRLHPQNTDTGTNSSSFQLNALSTGARLKDVSGVLQVRNSADTAFADLFVNNLTVNGTTTTVNSEQVNIADNILTLNSDVITGTPTENAGIEVSRGGQAKSTLLWVEASSRWFSGVTGSEAAIARITSRNFVAADLVAGVLTFVHNLGTNNIAWSVFDQNGEAVFPDTKSAAPNTATFDFKDVTLTGTWRAVVTG